MGEVQNNYNNNLGIYIPSYMEKHYINWSINYPEICQLDEDFNVIKIWNNKRNIAEYYGKRIQGVDLAIRNSCRFQGYYFVIKVLYDIGLRPVLKEKRNTAIYAYNPSDFILESYEKGEQFTAEDFFKDEYQNQFQFIKRYKNSVAAGSSLDLSVTNIRRVSKCELLFHKEYFFTFKPILRIHEVVADIDDLYSKVKSKITLKSDEYEKLISSIEEFKKIYSEEYRYVGLIEKRIKKLIDENQIESEIYKQNNQY